MNVTFWYYFVKVTVLTSLLEKEINARKKINNCKLYAIANYDRFVHVKQEQNIISRSKM